MKKISVFGCGGHAVSVMDTLKNKNEYEIAGFVDKSYSEYVYDGIGIIATDETIDTLCEKGIGYGALGVGSVHGNDKVRVKIYDNAINAGVKFPQIIDDSAIVSGTAIIDEGTFIGKGAIINSESHIGIACIINTGAIIEHCVEVGDFTHISVGCVVCGDVKIGNNCMIGANATIIQGVKIGNNVTVGAGAVVVRDVADGDTVVGNPARVIG